eukprot:Nk52_evm9s1779 gene=Nk52_evmTU9s1779
MSAETDSGIFVIVVLFACIAFGAFVRHTTKNLPVPYTVILLVSGFIFGLIADKSGGWDNYTQLSRMNPHLIIFVFLPTLIFESAFSMEIHTFGRILWQVLFLAGPGLVVMTVLTACVLRYIIEDFSWTVALMTGAILSATDPVAVVALLRDLGSPTLKKLSHLVEGESLLNDGTSIVVFMVFFEAAEKESLASAEDIFLQFITVAIGGPLVGLVFGMVATYWLSISFNDNLVEISVTLSFTYATFFVAEEYLRVSGILGVVVFGIYLNHYGKPHISPPVEHFLHEFWGILGFLANTLIFIIVGMIIAIQTNPSSRDFGMLVVLYIFEMGIRGFTILGAAPLLKRLGYGLTAKDAFVLIWGGLRGAVGLALAITVNESKDFIDHNEEGTNDKIMFYTAGTVAFTLIINGTSMKYIMKAMGMTDVPPARILVMRNAMNLVREKAKNTLKSMQSEAAFESTNWEKVESFILNPTKSKLWPIQAVEDKSIDVLAEARNEFVKSQKRTFWKMHEEGRVGERAVRILMSVADLAMDRESGMIKVEDIEPYWTLNRAEEYMYRMPIVRYAVKSSIQNHMAVGFEVATSFLEAEKVVSEKFEEEWQALLDGAVEQDEPTANESAEGERPVRESQAKLSRTVTSLSRHTLQKNENMGTMKYSGLNLSTIHGQSRMDSLKDIFFTSPVKDSNEIRGFSGAHRLVKIIKDWETGEFHLPRVGMYAEKVLAESAKTRDEVKAALLSQKRAFPDIIESLETKTAVRSVLSAEREEISKLEHEGLIDEAESGKLAENTNKRLKMLIGRTIAKPKEHSLDELLKGISWLSNCQAKTLQELKSRSSLRAFSHGDPVIKPNCPGISIISKGTVNVIRIDRPTVAEVHGAGMVIGEETLLGLPSAYSKTGVSAFQSQSPSQCSLDIESECEYFRPEAETIVELYFISAQNLYEIAGWEDILKALWKHHFIKHHLLILHKVDMVFGFPTRDLTSMVDEGTLNVIEKNEVVERRRGRITVLVHGKLISNNSGQEINAPSVLEPGEQARTLGNGVVVLEVQPRHGHRCSSIGVLTGTGPERGSSRGSVMIRASVKEVQHDDASLIATDSVKQPQANIDEVIDIRREERGEVDDIHSKIRASLQKYADQADSSGKVQERSKSLPTTDEVAPETSLSIDVEDVDQLEGIGIVSDT